MPILSIDIPNQHATRVADAFAAAYNYQATVPNPADPEGPQIPNPVSKAAFVKQQVTAFIRNVTTGHEAAAEAEVARKQRIDTNEAIEFAT